MDIQQKQAFIAYLLEQVAPTRREKMLQNVTQRTRQLTIVLEDIYYDQNVSAALRSIECCGLQDVHLIEKRHKIALQQNITKGACQWLSVHRYREPEANNTATCFEALRAEGYCIVATSPQTQDAQGCPHYQLPSLPLDRKLAIVFGTEETGLSEYALENADYTMTVPMHGFTGSFNIAATVAVVTYDVTQRLRALGDGVSISEQEQAVVMLLWLRRMIRGYESFEKLFLERQLTQ